MEDVCMTEERSPAPQYIPIPQPSPPRHQLRRHRFFQSPPEVSHAYQGTRQDSHHDAQQPHGIAGLVRQIVTIHRPEKNILPELPPSYSFHDPTQPLPFLAPGLTLPKHWRVQDRPECAQTHNNPFPSVLRRAIEIVHRHIKDVPKVVKAAPTNLKWLKKHNYLSE